MLQVDGFLYRTELTSQQQVSAAWMQAAWQRSKRMPSLVSILKRLGGGKAKKATPEAVETAKRDFKTLVDEMAGDLNIKEETNG